MARGTIKPGLARARCTTLACHLQLHPCRSDANFDRIVTVASEDDGKYVYFQGVGRPFRGSANALSCVNRRLRDICLPVLWRVSFNALWLAWLHGVAFHANTLRRLKLHHVPKNGGR
jgi:hypothetical protein